MSNKIKYSSSPSSEGEGNTNYGLPRSLLLDFLLGWYLSANMEEVSSNPWSRSLIDIKLLVAIGAIFLAQTIWQWYRLSHIPGPFWAGFSRFWFLNESIHKRTPMSSKRASDKYGEIFWLSYLFRLEADPFICLGSLFRVGPNALLTDDPEVLRKMMAVRSPYTKSKDWYQASRFDPSKDHLVSLCDEAEHARLRSKMAAGVGTPEPPSRLPQPC